MRKIKSIYQEYKVYCHTNLINYKKYIGITKKASNERWKQGKGYTANEDFYNDIAKYGWDSFKHEILEENCDYKTARRLESYYIKKYNTINTGYNNTNSSIGEKLNFDFFDFIPLDSVNINYTSEKKYFTRVPNSFTRINLQKMYGVHKIFIIVYILIDRHRSYEDQSYITISDIFNFCGYKISRNKPKIFYEIIKILLFLSESNYIEITSNFDIYNIGYNDCISLNIISKNFDAVENYSKITSKQIDSIKDIKTNIKKENILLTFLYINSYIYIRPKDIHGNELMEKPQDKPEAFWKSIEGMSKELSMSKDTINQCIKCLLNPGKDIEPLLIKKEVGSIQSNPDIPPKNLPNIYVLNKDGYKQEIEWALNKIIEIYSCNFDDIKGGKK